MEHCNPPPLSPSLGPLTLCTLSSVTQPLRKNWLLKDLVDTDTFSDTSGTEESLPTDEEVGLEQWVTYAVPGLKVARILEF